MKSSLTIFVFLVTFFKSFSQINESEFVKTQVSFEYDSTDSVIALLKSKNKTKIFSFLNSVILAKNAEHNELGYVSRELTDSTGLFHSVQHDQNAAVIVIYRDMEKAVQNRPGTTSELVYTANFESLNSIIYSKPAILKANKKKNVTDTIWSDYLLDTRKAVIIYIDYDNGFYRSSDDEHKQLSNSEISINYHSSFLKTSLRDLKTVVMGSMSGQGMPDTPRIKITVALLNRKAIKSPCDIVIQNKSFKKNLEFEIHELNFASFQVGVINNKYRVNNFSIEDGNLIVKPDESQKGEWKSNLFAVFEFHPIGYGHKFGRDIDNFNPIWKDLFSSKRDVREKGKAWKWFKDITISRIGIYGGLKISKDPLSSLHAGINYAITKELYLNFGWVWLNEITPQVTAIGEITSISDASKYAKRKYASAKFSWGLSFAPTSVIAMLGIKNQAKE